MEFNVRHDGVLLGEQSEAILTALCIEDRNDIHLEHFHQRNGSPFEAVTTELSSEKYVSASKIISMARGLQKISLSDCSTGICKKALPKHLSEPARAEVSLIICPVICCTALAFEKGIFGSSSVAMAMTPISSILLNLVAICAETTRHHQY